MNRAYFVGLLLIASLICCVAFGEGLQSPSGRDPVARRDIASATTSLISEILTRQASDAEILSGLASETAYRIASDALKADVVALASETIDRTSYDAYLLGLYGDIATRSIATFTATSGQTAFTLPFNYRVGANSLLVFAGGLAQRRVDDYTETASDTVTFTSGLPDGTTVLFYDCIATLKAEYSTVTTGNTTVFNLPFDYTIGGKEIMVFFGGLVQRPIDDFTESSTTSITSTSVIGTGTTVQFIKR